MQRKEIEQENRVLDFSIPPLCALGVLCGELQEPYEMSRLY